MDKFKLFCFVGEPYNVTSHWHIDHEVLLVLTGGLEVQINGKSRCLYEGDMAFINGRNMHLINMLDKDSRVLTVHFDPAVVLLGFDDPKDANNIYFDFNTGGAEIAEKARFQRIIAQLGRWYIAELDGRRFECPGLLLQLLGLMVNHGMRRNKSAVDDFKYETRKRLSDLIEYIQDNYDQPLQIGDAAAALNVSAPSVARILRQTAGMSFTQYLNMVRVEEMKKNLLNGDPNKSVTELIQDCGFDSLPSFYRVFKKHTGMNPKQYRESLQSSTWPSDDGTYRLCALKHSIELIDQFAERNRLSGE